MSIKEELLALEDARGFINPNVVVGWAERNRKSEIGQRLEWDDPTAAHAYRLEQVRLLIRVYIRDEDNERLTISLISDRHQDGGYRSIERVMSHAEMREAALAQALSELERMQEKYDHLQELGRVFAEVKRARAKRPRTSAAKSAEVAASV